MITIKHKGNFNNSERFLNNAIIAKHLDILMRYGKEGVKALASVTPVKTGKTRDSWDFKIVRDRTKISIIWINTNVVNGTPIAVILQYGHATGTGGWVEGIDYINPIIRPVFDKMANDIWREVTK